MTAVVASDEGVWDLWRGVGRSEGVKLRKEVRRLLRGWRKESLMTGVLGLFLRVYKATRGPWLCSQLFLSGSVLLSELTNYSVFKESLHV